MTQPTPRPALTDDQRELIADLRDGKVGPASLGAAAALIEQLAADRDFAWGQARSIYQTLKTIEAERDTVRDVARGNKRHVATLTEVIERVEQFADEMAMYCSPHGVATMYADRLRKVLAAPTSAEVKP